MNANYAVIRLIHQAFLHVIAKNSSGLPDMTIHHRHVFKQADWSTLKLCDECGMWPEHHNHMPSYGSCVCVQCHPTALTLPSGCIGEPLNDNYGYTIDSEWWADE